MKYLGSVVDENLIWDDHIDYIFVKIRRNIGSLKRMRLTVPRESLVLQGVPKKFLESDAYKTSIQDTFT